MIRTPKFVLAVVFAVAAFCSQAIAQSSNLQYQVANLVEDQRLMMEQMRGVLTEMDELRRENSRLRALVEDYQGKVDRQSGNYATVGQVNELVRKTVSSLEARDDVMRKELVAQFGKQLDEFAKKIEGAINSVPSIAKPDPNVRTDFPSNYPSSGVPYNVAPGDSLAGIAKKFNSRIDWIQNANKISDPRLLQVGQRIFVPQASE
ncbi:LysM domain protein [Verrucomicrobiia bacterium DG1235]|nr:LysM domain protein [Verrucomicrobiae bacterium DG1235]